MGEYKIRSSDLKAGFQELAACLGGEGPWPRVVLVELNRPEEFEAAFWVALHVADYDEPFDRSPNVWEAALKAKPRLDATGAVVHGSSKITIFSIEWLDYEPVGEDEWDAHEKFIRISVTAGSNGFTRILLHNLWPEKRAVLASFFERVAQFDFEIPAVQPPAGTIKPENSNNLNRLERGIVDAVKKRRDANEPLTDEYIVEELAKMKIYNRTSGKPYTREWINKTKNNLIQRGYGVDW